MYKTIKNTTLRAIKKKEVLSTVNSIPTSSNTTTTVTSNNINVLPTKIKISSEWERYLPHLEKATKVENLKWSGSHEKAFKELTSFL